jgi:hypothetical protein
MSGHWREITGQTREFLWVQPPLPDQSFQQQGALAEELFLDSRFIKFTKREADICLKCGLGHG